MYGTVVSPPGQPGQKRFFWTVTLSLAMSIFAARLSLAAEGRIEATFELRQLQGNPFDFTANDVQVHLLVPRGGEISIPAFFDGGSTWRVRHTPAVAGRYIIKSITLNGNDAKPQSLDNTEFNVAVPPEHRFVRIDPKNKMRFAFDDGSPYYPVGYNLAWQSHGPVEMPPLTDSLNRMGRAGVNWTRIWMNYWDGKNLDWPLNTGEPLQTGTLLLPVARSWDAIVDAAQNNHVFFQMVLQHHGQYSSRTDTNWSRNPWNKTNGGWLETPEQFFTDPRAIQLTKSKYRYIIARWGFSPAIMAFELFNEVDSTDGFQKDLRSVAAWHEMMADFIRAQDHYQHLITTSAAHIEAGAWPGLDYYQAHAYPGDLISAITGLDDQKPIQPYFYGEMGAASGSSQPPRDTLHSILWASLMSGSAGTGQYWDWFEVEPRNLLGQFTSVQGFISQSKLLADPSMHPIQVDVQTPLLGPLRFGPGRDWGVSSSTQFAVNRNGSVANAGGMSAFLQGTGANRKMFPFAAFDVNYLQPGTFAVEVDQVTAAGARLEASVDGKSMATLILAAHSKPGRGSDSKLSGDSLDHLNATLEFAVPSGVHTIRLENHGQDWIRIHQFVLTPYAPEIAVLAKASRTMAVLWAYRRTRDTAAQPISASITLDGLNGGAYRIVWWETDAGKIIKESTEQVTSTKPLTLTTPPIQQDAACWITRIH